MISQLVHSITIFSHGTLVLQTHRAEVNNRNPRNVGRHLVEQHEVYDVYAFTKVPCDDTSERASAW